MVDLIDELKRKYTDKYVVVDGSRPELARFRDTYGTVKTVNMSGRALVEFADYHLNIGWYDIDTAFLKLVDTPPAPKVKEAPAKGEPAANPAPKPAAKPVAGSAKQSTSDILAALRAGGGAKAPTKGEPASAGGEAKPKPAAAPKASGSAPAKVDRSKMSVADMLAAARAGGAKPPGEPASAGGSAGGEQPEQVEAPADEPVAAEAPAPAAKAPSGPIDKKSMTIDQMIAWCREHDTK